MAARETDFITGDGRLVNARDIADIYRDVVSLSMPVSGKIQRLGENNYSLTCYFKATDCDVLESVNTSKAYSLTTTSVQQHDSESQFRYIESVRCITDPQTVFEIAVATSESGRYHAKLKSPTSGKNGDEEKQLLEIWDRSKLLKTLDISEQDTHGKINTSSMFASFCWSPFGEQDKLIYVCHKKQPKYQNFFKQTLNKVGPDSGDAPKGKLVNLGEDNLRKDDWGETLEGTNHLILAMLDVSAGCKITPLDMEGYCLGEAKWLDGLKTVSLAYPEKARRLGLVYCNNRPNRLVVHDWNESPPREVLNLNGDTYCYQSPRASHSGRKFIYLTSPAFGPHKRSNRFHLYDLDTNQDRELEDSRPKPLEHYMKGGLSDNCFSIDDKHIVFEVHDHLYSQLCIYNIETSTSSKIKFPTTKLELLDFRYNIILATGSEVNATPTLFVSVLNPDERFVPWHQLEDCLHHDEIDYEPYEIPTPDQQSFVSALLVTPSVRLLHKNLVTDPKQLDTGVLVSSELDLPTVVVVHGGPHSSFLLGYMPTIVVYARLGLRVLLINYRGSTGVSEDYSTSLCGNIGQLDVQDCLRVIRHFVDAKTIDPSKLVIQGGSHGGFLACHLSCVEEFKFTSAIILNPVVDLTGMHATTDIPDWVVVEGLGQMTFDYDRIPNSQQLVELFERSPISKYEHAHVPTLMLLGSLDKRVKMFQGERWFELLRARGVKAECKVYADNHSLGKISSASDVTITSIMWILSNLRATS